MSIPLTQQIRQRIADLQSASRTYKEKRRFLINGISSLQGFSDLLLKSMNSLEAILSSGFEKSLYPSSSLIYDLSSFVNKCASKSLPNSMGKHFLDIHQFFDSTFSIFRKNVHGMFPEQFQSSFEKYDFGLNLSSASFSIPNDFLSKIQMKFRPVDDFQLKNQFFQFTSSQKYDTILKNLKLTHQELLNEITSLEDEVFQKKENTRFQNYATVKKNNLFIKLKSYLQDASSDIHVLLKSFQSKLDVFQVEFNDTFNKFVNSIESMRKALKDYQAAQANSEMTKLNKLKIEIFTSALTNADVSVYEDNPVYQFGIYEMSLKGSIETLMKNDDMSEIETLLDSALEKYVDSEAVIKKESEKMVQKRTKIQKAVSSFVPKHPPSDATREKQLEDLTFNLKNVKNLVEGGVNDISAQMQKLIDEFQNLSRIPHFFPERFTETFNENTQDISKARMEKTRLSVLNEILEEKKMAISQLTNEIELKKSKIAEKKNEYAKLKETAQSQKPRNKSSLKDMTELSKQYMCGICRAKPRKVMTECNHTFCSACLKKQFSLRNRKCPYCTKICDPKHAVKIKWDS